MKITVIVNGSDTEVGINMYSKLEVVIAKALKQTANIRPISDWNLYYDDYIIDKNKKIKDLPFDPSRGVTNIPLFLSLKSASGGVDKIPTIVSTNIYSITRQNMSDGGYKITRENNGFETMELIGHLALATADIMALFRDTTTPPDMLIIKERRYKLEK